MPAGNLETQLSILPQVIQFNSIQFPNILVSIVQFNSKLQIELNWIIESPAQNRLYIRNR